MQSSAEPPEALTSVAIRMAYCLKDLKNNSVFPHLLPRLSLKLPRCFLTSKGDSANFPSAFQDPFRRAADFLKMSGATIAKTGMYIDLLFAVCAEKSKTEL